MKLDRVMLGLKRDEGKEFCNLFDQTKIALFVKKHQLVMGYGIDKDAM